MLTIPLSLAVPGPRELAAKALQWTTMAIALLLLVPMMSEAMPRLFEQGSLPFKPRDYKIGLSLIGLVLVIINRPAICLPALLLLLIPIIRLADAAILERFSVQSVMGDHANYVMSRASDLLVTIVGVGLLFTQHGYRIAVWVAVGTIFVVTGSTIYEWSGHAQWTAVPGRASGFLVDPNAPGIVLGLFLGIVLTLNKSFWWNVALIIVSWVGIALTLSRSGMIGLALIVVVYLIANLRKRGGALILIIAACAPLAIAGVAFLTASTERQGVVKDENATRRVQAIYELDFAKLWSGERAKDLSDGWEAVMKKPMLGHGTGSGTFWWQPHNEFVTLWVELGVAGPLLFFGLLMMLIIGVARSRFRGFYGIVPVLFYIPFSQVMIEWPSYWFAAAVVACVTSPKRYALGLRSSAALHHDA